MRTGRMHHILAKEQHRYGKIMRIGPNELLVYDPETLWRMSSVRSTYGRGNWYASIQFDPYGHSVLSEPDTAKHDKCKAQIGSGYAGKGNVNLEQKVDSQIAILVNILKAKILNKNGQGIVDFGRLVRFFQIDVVTLVGSGEPWGDLATETDNFDFISIADGVVPFLHSFMMIPLLRDFFASTFFLSLAGPKATDKKGMGRFLGIIKRIVEKRFSDTPSQIGGQGDMLGEWIKHGLTRRECELELAIQVPAGSETSSTAIRGIMLYLLSSPKAYQRLQEEISSGIEGGLISDPITQEEAKRMPYLQVRSYLVPGAVIKLPELIRPGQAVIHEGLRMVPPTTMGFPKKVPAGGDTLCGKFVPEGTDVFVNVCSLLRNKEVFGEDADIFRPERFLEYDTAKKAELIKNVDLAFGHGRWMCPGKTLAWFELNKIFVEVRGNVQPCAP
ncbi:CWF complex protein sap62 [Hypoxylon texense]